jgi:hypothetical protein
MLIDFKYHSENKTKLWKVIMIISIVLFMAILVVLSVVLVRMSKGKGELAPPAIVASSTEKQSAACPGCSRRKIDGTYVDPGLVDLPLVAIMIDNHPDARPQSGIDKANLVYEAEVEGYYTRLMAVFTTSDVVDKIGPVRSARPYFVDWAEELKAVYGHCGGSPEALVDIEQRGLIDFDQFYNGKYFWRGDDKSAPHNIYTSSDYLKKFLIKENVSAADYTAWKFKDDSPADNSSSSQPILIDYKAADFKVSWKYNRGDNDYVRYFKGAPELTADKKEIRAKNLIIQIVPATVVDNDLRLKMNDVGYGRATICLDGICRSGSWAKADYNSRTIFSYDNGIEAEFNAGSTWVEVMRPN